MTIKYFDNPEQNAAFLQFIDVLAQLTLKYGGNVVFPPEEEMRVKWAEILQSTQSENNQCSQHITIELDGYSTAGKK